MHYLTACCIARNEQPYIREWVDYHLRVGVESFIVYDDSLPRDIPLAMVLRDHIERGTVRVERPIAGELRQMASYDDCLQRFAHTSTWIAFFDVDEFLVPKSAPDLRVLLTAHESEAGFAASWLVFGPSGHLTPPPGLVTSNYVWRSEAGFKQNTHVKSIVQPRYAVRTRNPHAFDFRPGHRCVDEHGEVVENAFRPNSTDTIQINHYVTKSRQEFMHKVSRGRPNGGNFLHRTFFSFASGEEMFAHYEKHCSVVEDRFVQRYIAAPPGPDGSSS